MTPMREWSVYCVCLDPPQYCDNQVKPQQQIGPRLILQLQSRRIDLLPLLVAKGPLATSHKDLENARLDGPLLLTWINFNPSMLEYIHYKVWDEITYPFQNFNGAGSRWSLGMDN